MPEEKPFSIRLLGRPEASLRGRPLRFNTKKALALLCYLAAEGKKYPRGELAELLWPRSDRRSVRTALRSALANLRKTLGEDHAHDEEEVQENRVLLADGDLLGVEPGGIELDLRALKAAVSLARGETSVPSVGIPLVGRGANNAVGHGDLLDRLEGALGIYGGEFMEGFSLQDAPEFELWLELERERWRSLFGELCEGVSRLQAGAGRLGEAIGTARLWTGHAPLGEDAHLRLMGLLSAGGDGEGALRAYEYFRGVLRRELGSEPSPRLTELADRLRKEVEEKDSLVPGPAHLTTTLPSAFEIPFVDRHEEFGALVYEYHACLSGQEPRVVAVMGEAGIGKTRLAKEFLGWARARGADVLEGAASEGAGVPYGPLVEALRPRIEMERAPDDLLEDAWLSELSRLLPELRERYSDLPPPASGEGETAKGALFEAVARAVGALASRAPVVLFLDDLQWADAATLEVLDYTGRRWAEQGVAVLLLSAARPEELGDAFAVECWPFSLGRKLPVRRLAPGPFGSEDVGGVLRRLAKTESTPPAGAPEQLGDSSGARTGPERFAAPLLAETGGQPFYLVETLKALLEDGKLVIRKRADGEMAVEVGPAWREGSTLRGLLPQSVREVIHARLSRLSSAAYELLTAGAVLERGFGFESAVRVAGLGEAEGLKGLDELIERRLLREEAGGRDQGEEPLSYADATYSFSHEKIRQVAYTDCGQARRWVLHRRAFEVLERSGAPLTELAHHALAGGLAKEALAYSLAAGDEAAEVFAVRDAIGHYERARDLLAAKERQPGGAIEPPFPHVEHLYSKLGRTYEMADRWEQACETYETMLAIARGAGEARLEVAALNHLAGCLFHHETDRRKVRDLLDEARLVGEEANLPMDLVDS